MESRPISVARLTIDSANGPLKHPGKDRQDVYAHRPSSSRKLRLDSMLGSPTAQQFQRMSNRWKNHVKILPYTPRATGQIND